MVVVVALVVVVIGVVVLIVLVVVLPRLTCDTALLVPPALEICSSLCCFLRYAL